MTRDEAYAYFGPMLVEAIVRKLIDEINILRDDAGLLPRTQTQVVDAIIAEYQTLSKYDWMDQPPP